LKNLGRVGFCERYRDQIHFFRETLRIDREVPLPEHLGTVLDLGTGEGRIGGILARLGFRVLGLDISRNQLEKGRHRITEEGAGLRDEQSNPLLSYNALKSLEIEGTLPHEPIIDDELVSDRYCSEIGDFMSVHRRLNEIVDQWEQLFPNTDKHDFFGESPYNKFAFRDSSDYFADIGFDTVLFNWHTFCEIGSVDNQLQVLKQLFNVMKPGGVLVIEIPDRTVGPYAASLAEYHKQHPSEPFGTIRDATSTEDGISTSLEAEEDTPRFFPDRNELVLLLKSVGFDIKPEEDVQTYLVKKKGQDGKEYLQVKELFIFAQKPEAIAKAA
jgi:SAM-dependent methyltransferase